MYIWLVYTKLTFKTTLQYWNGPVYARHEHKPCALPSVLAFK